MNAITRAESALISQNLKTTSLVVAEKFGKEHRNVLRDIRNLPIPDNYRKLNFEPFKINDLTGESTSHVEMTRDGFSLLVMGFTGKKTMEWKIKFLQAFNAMEKQLSSPATAALPPVPKLTPSQMVEIQKQMFLRFPDGPRRAQAYIALKEHFGVARYYEIEESRFDEAIAFIQSAPLCCSPEKALERTELAEAEVKRLSFENEGLNEDSKALARIATADGELCLRDTAKTLQKPQNILSRYLLNHGWTYKQYGQGPHKAYSSKLNAQLLIHREHILKA